MDRIIFKFGIPFRKGEEGDLKPVPPLCVLSQDFQLIVRLESTRSGASAWWEAGERARRALNSAPFQPVLRAIVSDFQLAHPWPARGKD